jgi:glycosyltransferase involved in cell wall biosynthesis
VLEALAAGKPVLVNEEGGLKELADKFNEVYPVRLYEPDDMDNLKKLATIMEQRKGQEVRADLRAYDWDTIAEKTKNIYSSVGF